jgi:hypothetical protein
MAELSVNWKYREKLNYTFNKKIDLIRTFEFVLIRNVISQEQIYAMLFLCVAERIAVITAERLHDVIAL